MRSIILFLAIVAVPLAGAQDPPAAVPVPGDPAALARDLGSDDFAKREGATRALRELGEKARGALLAVKDSENLEQRTRARRLLEEFSAGVSRPEDPERARDRLRQRRLRPVEPSPAPTSGGEEGNQGRRLRLHEMPRPEQFDGLDAYFDALQRFMGEALSPRPSVRNPLEDLIRRGLEFPEVRESRSSQGTTRIIQNGQSLELTRRPDGGLVFQVGRTDAQSGSTEIEGVYTAGSLEDFKQRHGPIYEQYRKTGLFDDTASGFRIVFSGGSVFPAPVRPRRAFGVVVQDVPVSVRAHVAVPDRAVIVEEVALSSPAARMGLRRYDIITHLDGQAVGSGADIRAGLEGAAAEIRVRILRKGKVKELSGPRPKAR